MRVLTIRPGLGFDRATSRRRPPGGGSARSGQRRAGHRYGTGRLYRSLARRHPGMRYGSARAAVVVARPAEPGSRRTQRVGAEVMAMGDSPASRFDTETSAAGFAGRRRRKLGIRASLGWLRIGTTDGPGRLTARRGRQLAPHVRLLLARRQRDGRWGALVAVTDPATSDPAATVWTR